MTVAIVSDHGNSPLIIKITGSATTHDLGNILNPEGETLLLDKATMYNDTAGLATCDLHVGIGAASAGVGNADVFADHPVDGTAGKAYNGFHSVAANTEDTAPALWHDDDYLTFYTDTAYSTGFVGYLFLAYTKLTVGGSA